MPGSPNIAALAAQLADPARAQMLLALMGGRALTVSELALVAGVTKATASGHLTRLEEAGLLSARRQGRHKYLTLSGPDVARLIEALMAVAAGPASVSRVVSGAKAPRTGPRDPALREARLCYNHLAGSLGVQVYRSLSARGYLVHVPGGLDLTPEGCDFARGLGIPAADLAPARAPLCRDCLDWSERQNHLAGRFGRLILAAALAKGWLHRQAGTRALLVTPQGRAGFRQHFPELPPDDRQATGDLGG